MFAKVSTHQRNTSLYIWIDLLKMNGRMTVLMPSYMTLYQNSYHLNYTDYKSSTLSEYMILIGKGSSNWLWSSSYFNR